MASRRPITWDHSAGGRPSNRADFGALTLSKNRGWCTCTPNELSIQAMSRSRFVVVWYGHSDNPIDICGWSSVETVSFATASGPSREQATGGATTSGIGSHSGSTSGDSYGNGMSGTDSKCRSSARPVIDSDVTGLPRILLYGPVVSSNKEPRVWSAGESGIDTGDTRGTNPSALGDTRKPEKTSRVS